MSSIFSSISGQFSKSLILGTFAPTAVFAILCWIFVVPLVPNALPLLAPIQALDPQWQVVAISLLTTLLSALLYNLNIPIIRFYEGYQWSESAIGRWRTAYHQASLRAAQARRAGMGNLLFELPETDQRYERLTDEWSALGRDLLTEFPQVSEVLPTRLGNVIRSFEDYPKSQYGISAIPLWPRLIATIDKEYATAIDDAKASFDFMINSSVLAALLAFLMVVAGLWFATPLASPALWLPWITEIVVFMGAAYLFYLGSLEQAREWGALVKGAFDLYRWDLLQRLGYKAAPTTRRQERELWNKISGQMIFGDRPSGPRIDYDSSPPFAHGKPYTAELLLTRGIERVNPAAGGGDSGQIKVTLVIKNAQPQPVRAIVVTDQLPAEFDYLWNSAEIAGQRAPVIGANPYHFTIGDLAAQDEKILTYCAIQRSK